MTTRTPQSISDAITKFLTIKRSSVITLKRSYDNWAIKQIWADTRRRAKIRAQKLDIPLHQRLGSDLAVSKFVIGYCRGQVRDHAGRWVARNRDLPPNYSKNFKLTGINAANGFLLTEGIDNFVGLEHLEFLDLSENPELDDFACDQLARQFRQSRTLKEIDVSFNPRISVHGLDVLFRIPSIERIVAVETQATNFSDIDLFVLAAEDERNCEVIVHKDGRKYSAAHMIGPGT